VQKLTLDDARDLVTSRDAKPFKDSSDVKQRYPSVEFPDRFGVGTQYFLGVASAKFDRSVVAYEMLIARDPKGDIKLLWQKPTTY
jgi:hypothetical protein